MVLKPVINEFEWPSDVKTVAHYDSKFLLKNLTNPYLSLLEVAVQEVSEDGKVLVEVPHCD